MSSFADAAKKIENLKENIEPKVTEGLAEGVAELELATKQHADKGATGQLAEGIHSDTFTPERGFVGFRILGPDWWKFVEFGTGTDSSRGYPAPDDPPPHDDILRWIEAKGIVPEEDGPADNQDELAWVIAQDISSTGTQQSMFARPAWRGPAGKSNLEDKISEALNEAIREAM